MNLLIPHKGHNIYSYTVNPELVINNEILKLSSSEMGNYHPFYTFPYLKESLHYKSYLRKFR